MTEPILMVENLHAAAEETRILNGVELAVPKGGVHAIMGPNGSGKSTLANVLMGHPAYTVTAGRVLFKGQDVTTMPPDERARLGMFLAFQYPVEIPGVSVLNFLRTATNAVRGRDVPIREFRELVKEKVELLGMDMSFARRNLNEGFSGGEKKRNEILQLSVLAPALAILDETDSGLDIDAIKTVAAAVNRMRGPEVSFLVITHYLRVLTYLEPDMVHVLMGGRVVRSGGPELAHRLEAEGYEGLRKGLGLEGLEGAVELRETVRS